MPCLHICVSARRLCFAMPLLSNLGNLPVNVAWRTKCWTGSDDIVGFLALMRKWNAAWPVNLDLFRFPRAIG